MLYSKIFVAAMAAITSVSAMPAEAADRDRGIFLDGACFDEGDEVYCGRGLRELSRYDRGSNFCRIDNINKVFCAVRNQQEFYRQIAEEWGRIERCAIDEYWDIRTRRCDCYGRRGRDSDRERDRECRRRRGGRGGRDGDRDGDRFDDDRGDRGRERNPPDCKNGDIAFCARNEDEIITFQRESSFCTRGNGNYVFCASPERGRAREKARDHFRDRRDNDRSAENVAVQPGQPPAQLPAKPAKA